MGSYKLNMDTNEDFSPILKCNGKGDYKLVSDHEALIQRISERKDKRTRMIFQKVIICICLIILGLLAYLTYSGHHGINAQDSNQHDQDIQKILNEELIVDLLKGYHSRNNNPSFERKERDLNTVTQGPHQNQDAEENSQHDSQTEVVNNNVEGYNLGNGQGSHNEVQMDHENSDIEENEDRNESPGIEDLGTENNEESQITIQRKSDNQTVEEDEKYDYSQHGSQTEVESGNQNDEGNDEYDYSQLSLQGPEGEESFDPDYTQNDEESHNNIQSAKDMDKFISGGHYNGNIVNNKTYYSDTVYDCQRRCKKKKHCIQFNFKKDDGEEDGECILLSSITSFIKKPDCTSCKTGPKFSIQPQSGPIVIKKIIAQISSGYWEGTDDLIRFRFKSGDDECLTKVLDERGNSWVSNKQESHDISCEIENPGKSIQLQARFEMDPWGVTYDELCLKDFRVTLDDGSEYVCQEKLCGEGKHTKWVALMRVL